MLSVTVHGLLLLWRRMVASESEVGEAARKEGFGGRVRSDRKRRCGPWRYPHGLPTIGTYKGH
jgi:hypothetical protein